MDPLKPRFLGETGVQVTPLGLGAAQLGELYVKVSENQAQQTQGRGRIPSRTSTGASDSSA